MTPERWQQVKEIFDGAVECGPASRVAFLRERCGDDEELRREVESFLAADPEHRFPSRQSSHGDGPDAGE